VAALPAVAEDDEDEDEEDYEVLVAWPHGKPSTFAIVLHLFLLPTKVGVLLSSASCIFQYH
jgi:hypothetical protein